MTFEEWWKTVEEDVEDNCENRMDEFDACQWLRKAFKDGQLEGVTFSYDPKTTIMKGNL